MAKVILLVDDEEDFLFEVKKMLEKRNLKVITAKNGDEALDILKDTTPDLVLLDVMMPGMDGWTLAKMIKRRPETKDVTISMLTVKNTIDDKIESMAESGAEWHISKPIDMEKFITTVNWLLETPPKRV